MKRLFSMVLIFLVLFNKIVFAEDIGIEKDVRAYLIADYRTGEILEGYNYDELVEIASITKLMTYLVTMDEIKSGKISLTDRITMDEDSIKVGGSTINISIGDTFTLDELIDMSLIVSANNATHRIARYVAGSEENFVLMMNKKAENIGLGTAKFYNSTGLPVKEIDDQNKMKVTDLLKMSRYIIAKYPEVLERTSKPFLVDKQGEVIKNTNPILDKIKGVDGLKTGFTNKAGHCLVATLEKDKEDKDGEATRFIGIVMGSKGEAGREKASEKLMAYAINNYSDKKILAEDKKVKTIYNKELRRKKMDIYPLDEFRKVIDKNKEIEVKVELKEKIKYPLKPGKPIGKIIVKENGENIFETTAIVKEKVKKANIMIRLFRRVVETILA